MMKAPTVTLPANLLAAQAAAAAGQGGGANKAGGGGGMKKAGGGGPGGIRPPGGPGGGGQVAANPGHQLYMNQLMALIQKRPDMKSQITQILGRGDLNDSQRIEYIGEILKAANIATSTWAQGGPGGGGGGAPGGP